MTSNEARSQKRKTVRLLIGLFIALSLLVAFGRQLHKDRDAIEFKSRVVAEKLKFLPRSEWKAELEKIPNPWLALDILGD